LKVRYVPYAGLYIIPWQKTLLDLHGQIQREFQLVALFQTLCHFINNITRVSDGIVRCDPDLSVKIASADFLKNFPDIRKRSGQIYFNQQRQYYRKKHKNDGFNHYDFL
jgi:hypothetical protein